MKFIKPLILLLLLVPSISNGQKLAVTGKSGEPVSQAVIMLKLPDSEQPLIFLTDNNGLAEVGTFLSKVQVLVKHVSFIDYIDSLDQIKADLNIRLTAKDVNLDEVIVTSEFIPKTMGESIAPVTVINRTQIDNQAAANLETLLSQQLNIRISQDAALGSSMSMNGLSGQNIKFLVDGVPVIGRLDGNIDLSQINLNNVERIEVVNGPMATSYGTDAAGGVVNLITRQSVDKKYETGFNSMYESIGQYNIDGFAGFNTGKSSVFVSGGRNFFDGWSAKDTGRWQEWKPKEQIFGSAKYRWIGKDIVASFTVNLFDEKLSNKGNPRVTPYAAYAFDEYYKTQRITNQIQMSYVPGRDKLVSASLAHSYYRRVKNSYIKDLVTLNETLIAGTEEQDTTLMNTFTGRATFSGASKDFNIKYQTGLDFTHELADGSRFNEEVKSNGDYALFLSAEYARNSKLEIKPGVRIAYNTNFKAPVIPSLSVKYQINKIFAVRGSYGKGFRAPGLKEMYLYFVDINHNIQGNDNLLPEYSDNFYGSVSAIHKYNTITFNHDLSAFYNSMRNLITLAQPDPENSLFTYVNLGKFSTHGINYKVNGSFKEFSAGAGVSYTGRYNIYSDSADFDQYIYSPDFSANMQYHLTKVNLTFSVFFKFNGKLPGYKLNDDGSVSQFTNDSYRFLDATIRKGFYKNKFIFAAGVKNILNVTNINAMNTASAHSSGNDEQAVGTGRSYFGKITFIFGK